MRNQWRVALFVCAASTALAACSDRPTSVPTAPTLPRSSVSVAALATLACDFTALKSDARDYAASNRMRCSPSSVICSRSRRMDPTQPPPTRCSTGSRGSRPCGNAGAEETASVGAPCSIDSRGDSSAALRAMCSQAPTRRTSAGAVGRRLDVRGAWKRRGQRSGRVRARLDRAVLGGGGGRRDVGREITRRDGAGRRTTATDRALIYGFVRRTSYSNRSESRAAHSSIARSRRSGAGALVAARRAQDRSLQRRAQQTRSRSACRHVLPKQTLTCATPPAFAMELGGESFLVFAA